MFLDFIIQYQPIKGEVLALPASGPKGNIKDSYAIIRTVGFIRTNSSSHTFSFLLGEEG